MSPTESNTFEHLILDAETNLGRGAGSLLLALGLNHTLTAL